MDRVRILDIKTLAVVDEINMHRFDPIYFEDLIDANLLWKSCYLYIQTKDQGVFLNIHDRVISVKIDFTFEDDQLLQTMKHAMFKENEPLI